MIKSAGKQRLHPYFDADAISLIFSRTYERRCINHAVSTRCRKSNVMCQKKRHVNFFNWYPRYFFSAWYPSAYVPTRKKGMNVSLHLARQNSVQCIANLSHFLCITFSKRRRKPNGRRYFPNNRQHLAGDASIFRSVARQHVRADARKTRVAANLITFDRSASSSLPRGSLTYRKRAAPRSETRTTYSALSVRRWTSKCNATAVPYEPRVKRNQLHGCESPLECGRGSDVLFSVPHSFHSGENYDLCEIKLLSELEFVNVIYFRSFVSFLVEQESEAREFTLKHIRVFIFTFLFF